MGKGREKRKEKREGKGKGKGGEGKKEKKGEEKRKEKKRKEKKRSKQNTNFDFNSVKVLSVVHTDNATNHLGDNDHVPKVSLNTSGAFTNSSLTLGLTKPLQESHVLALHSAVGKPPAGTSGEQVNELSIGEVEELLEVHTSVGKLAEGSLLGSLKGGGVSWGNDIGELIGLLGFFGFCFFVFFGFCFFFLLFSVFFVFFVSCF